MDFLSIIGGGAHTYALQAAAVPNMSFPTAVYVPLAAAIKKAAPSLPILHASRIVDPIQADQHAAAGQIDVVGTTRALLADPDLPRKTREGPLGAIRTCVEPRECWRSARTRSSSPPGLIPTSLPSPVPTANTS